MVCSMKYWWCSYVVCVLPQLIVADDYDAVYSFSDQCDFGDEIEIQGGEAFLVKSSYALLSGPSCTIGFYKDLDEDLDICVVPVEPISIFNCSIKLNYQKVKGINSKTYSCNNGGKEEYCLTPDDYKLYINIENGDSSKKANLLLKVYIYDDDYIKIIVIVVCVAIFIAIVTVVVCCYCKHKKNSKLSPGKVVAPPKNFTGAPRADNRQTQSFGQPLSHSYGLPQNYGPIHSYNSGPSQPQSEPVWNTQQQYGMQFERTPVPPINTTPNANELYGPPPSYSNFAQKS